MEELAQLAARWSHREKSTPQEITYLYRSSVWTVVLQLRLPVEREELEPLTQLESNITYLHSIGI